MCRGISSPEQKLGKRVGDAESAGFCGFGKGEIATDQIFNLIGQSADKVCKRENCPEKKENRGRFLLSASAAHAVCDHLRSGKIPCLQVCFLGLQAFSSLWQSVDFVNILTSQISNLRRGPGEGETPPSAGLSKILFDKLNINLGNGGAGRSFPSRAEP